jgi:hypothetical protein
VKGRSSPSTGTPKKAQLFWAQIYADSRIFFVFFIFFCKIIRPFEILADLATNRWQGNCMAHGGKGTPTRDESGVD